ncbi:type II toxin-antitoxin system RelE/ParE family toxin [Candidatus Microgenomates bacterium]|nr:type II toxin-antitoxin system RelE/ParE family toxin [Candidatus Microgenomates bacterium]
MFQVKLSNQAKKDLKRLDQIYKPKATKYIDLLAINPFLGQKMTGEFQGSYRIKIPPLRIIYTPDLKNKIIRIKAIGFRGRVYR